MKLARRLSLYLLSLFSVFGIFRGLRMIWGFSDSNLPLLFPFSHVQESLFANYGVLGWVILLLIGVLGGISFWFTLRRKHIYPYMVLVEGIFVSSMISAHAIYGGFHWVHLVMLFPGIGLIVLGVFQAPREF
ncbi:MAG TPA: hypothetical protein VG842_01885 [Sediminibacterium sp.]|nr:hypothetical protein [Sediminibacterium sp.]